MTQATTTSHLALPFQVIYTVQCAYSGKQMEFYTAAANINKDFLNYYIFFRLQERHARNQHETNEPSKSRRAASEPNCASERDRLY